MVACLVHSRGVGAVTAADVVQADFLPDAAAFAGFAFLAPVASCGAFAGTLSAAGFNAAFDFRSLSGPLLMKARPASVIMSVTPWLEPVSHHTVSPARTLASISSSSPFSMSGFTTFWTAPPFRFVGKLRETRV
jgi:hypothetical protein